MSNCADHNVYEFTFGRAHITMVVPTDADADQETLVGILVRATKDAGGSVTRQSVREEIL